MDPSRAGPGGSSVEDTGGGGGKCAVSRFDRAVPQEKAAQGQVHKNATLGVYFIVYDHSQKLSKSNGC